MRVCLVIIFNHRFDRNIPILEKLYSERFPDIFHLVPFYDGNQENVIPVYESSYYFQGYLPQAWEKLKSEKFTHYFFISDDLLLNPSIDSNNCIEILKLSLDSVFLPDPWGVITDLTAEWSNFMPSVNAFYLKDLLKHNAPKWQKSFLDKETAIIKLRQYDLEAISIKWTHLFDRNKSYHYPHFYNRLKNFIQLKRKGRFQLPYPLVSGYSDTFVIPNQPEILKIFLQRLEVSRQMRLWVETALPTLILTSFDKVIMERDIGWRGSTYWDQQSLDKRFNHMDYLLENLLVDFGERELFIHPVKLSKWKI